MSKAENPVNQYVSLVERNRLADEGGKNFGFVCDVGSVSDETILVHSLYDF